MFVCLFSVEIQTAGQIEMKFGTEVVLKRRKVLGGGGSVQDSPPPRCRVCKGGQGASGASGVCFGKNFIKQKLQEAPDLVGTGHLFGPQIRISKDLGPMSFWSHCHSL